MHIIAKLHYRVKKRTHLLTSTDYPHNAFTIPYASPMVRTRNFSPT